MNVRLNANERLLSCKGFVLVTVKDNGDLGIISDMANLNAVERIGLTAHTKGFNEVHVTTKEG